MMPRIVVVIPARMGSSRFPGKPLAPIGGAPMIRHVWERSRRCEAVAEAYIATCDAEIRDAARAFGAPVIMTSDRHTRASDRVAEAARGLDADVVVMVQGDEPMVTPDMIAAAIEPFGDPGVQCVNLLGTLDDPDDFRSPHTIKVVVNARSEALFMSRQPIPTSPAGTVPEGVGKQVCIIPFRASALELFSSLPEGRLERAESIDMLRFLEHGVPVRMVPTDVRVQAVDTPADLERVQALMAAGA